MTVEIGRERLWQSQRPKVVFANVRDAKAALAADTLGTIYWRVEGVYVVTASGSGTFTRTRVGRGMKPRWLS